jgi:hypothetical protein
MSLLLIPVYAKPEKPKKNQPTPEYHVILGDQDYGPIYWEGDNNVGIRKKVGISVRVFFNNIDPNAVEYSVKIWPGILGGDPTGDLITVIGSDHLNVGFWWERAQQIQLARMSFAFFDTSGVEWLLKLEGFEIDPDHYVGGDYTITFTRFSLTEVGDPIGPYTELVAPLVVTLSFSEIS